MLLEVSIKNFAIIEHVSLNFETGMTILSGETGAGKSIIIDAMNLMLGARATTDVIRHGAPKAEIEGLFSFENSRVVKQILTDQGIEVADELIIRREILQNGRSVSRVNGQMVNLAKNISFGNPEKISVISPSSDLVSSISFNKLYRFNNLILSR